MSFAFANSSSSISPTASHLTSPSPGPDLKDQCPTDSFMFLVTVEIITAVIGFPGNVCVIYLLLRGEVGRPTSDVFTLSLAVLDTVYCLLLPLHPLSFFDLLKVDIFKFLLFLLGLNEIGGPLFLSCICIDRYIAVVHPVVFLKLSNGRHRSIAAALVWLVTLGHSSFMVGSSVRPRDWFFVGLFLAVFLVILLCNVFVLRALRQSGPASRALHPVKKRAYHTLLTIFIINVISLLPATVTYPFEELFPAIFFQCRIFPICYAFITLRAALQALFFLSRAWGLPCMTRDLNCSSENDKNCLCC